MDMGYGFHFLSASNGEDEKGGYIKMYYKFNPVVNCAPKTMVKSDNTFDSFWDFNLKLIRSKINSVCDEDGKATLLEKYEWLMTQDYLTSLLHDLKMEIKKFNLESMSKLLNIQKINQGEIETIIDENPTYESVSDAITFLMEYPHMMKNSIKRILKRQKDFETVNFEEESVQNQTFKNKFPNVNINYQEGLSNAQPLVL